MEQINSLLDWAGANKPLLWWLFAASVALFVLTSIVVSWTLIQLPPDYFVKQHRRPLGSWETRPILRLALLAAKNLLGIVLLAAGLAMILAPGQGLLTIAVGLILTDFPGKFRLQRWIVTRPSVWRSINWLRKRAKREQLQRPG